MNPKRKRAAEAAGLKKDIAAFGVAYANIMKVSDVTFDKACKGPYMRKCPMDDGSQGFQFVFNPEQWDVFTPKERVFASLHQMTHVMLSHYSRVKNPSDPDAQLAMDLAVNHTLMRNFNFADEDLPTIREKWDFVDTRKEAKGLSADLSVEDYLATFALRRMQQQQKQDQKEDEKEDEEDDNQDEQEDQQYQEQDEEDQNEDQDNDQQDGDDQDDADSDGDQDQDEDGSDGDDADSDDSDADGDQDGDEDGDAEGESDGEGQDDGEGQPSDKKGDKGGKGQGGKGSKGSRGGKSGQGDAGDEEGEDEQDPAEYRDDHTEQNGENITAEDLKQAASAGQPDEDDGDYDDESEDEPVAPIGKQGKSAQHDPKSPDMKVLAMFGIGAGDGITQAERHRTPDPYAQATREWRKFAFRLDRTVKHEKGHTSWTPNKRFVGLRQLEKQGMILPSYNSPAKNKIRMVLFMDTSGSCRWMSEVFMRIIRSIPRELFEVATFTHTTTVAPFDINSPVFPSGGTSYHELEPTLEAVMRADREAGKNYHYYACVLTDGDVTSMFNPKNPKQWIFMLPEYGGHDRRLHKDINRINLDRFTGVSSEQAYEEFSNKQRSQLQSAMSRYGAHSRQYPGRYY